MATTIESLVGNSGGPFQSTSTVMFETPSPIEIAPVSATLKLEPSEAKITSVSTITSESKIDSGVRLTFANRFDTSVELKPVSADVCFNVTLGRLPPTRVRQPYKQHVGLTLFGIEIVGIDLCGELDTVVEDAPRRPAILGLNPREPEPDGAPTGLRIRIG